MSADERTIEAAGPCRICGAKAGQECRSGVDRDMGAGVHAYGNRFGDDALERRESR